MSQKLVVLCNCGSADEAEKIARGIVEKQLAACANIVAGVRSIYRWQGAVEEATEWLIIIKTREEAYPLLEEEIRKLHSYSVPEIIALPVVIGSANYLDWIQSEVTTT